MYFWDLNSLKAILKVRPLTDRESLPYFFIYAFLFELDVYVSYALPSESVGAIEYLGDAIAAAIALVGIFWAYSRNGGRHGFSFLPRYFAIAWVVGIRLTVAAIAPLICLFGVFAAVETSGITIPDTVFDLVLYIFILAIEIVYCILIVKNVGDIADAWPKGAPPDITYEIKNVVSEVTAV